MDAISDFEDALRLLEANGVRYVIVGGLAVIYHAKPRYTKDIDLLVDPAPENAERVNRALSEFGSPFLLTPNDTEQIIQIGVAPNRIDLLARIEGVDFEEVWAGRIRDYYGEVLANWISLDHLIRAKQSIEGPRHREDLRVLLKVKRLREGEPPRCRPKSRNP